jgi:hypothetical protein
MMTGPYSSKLRFRSQNELLPEKDPGLDRICNFLMRGEPIFPGPGPKEQALTSGEEDEFFAKLEANPDLAKPRYLPLRRLWRRVRTLPRAALKKVLLFGARMYRKMMLTLDR